MENEAFFALREQATTDKVKVWAEAFERHIGADGAEALRDGCVYAVGSAGRGELGASSDLDVFIVTNSQPSRLDEILAQAALIKTMREFDLPKPSNDAAFLRLHSADEFEELLGHVEDDSPQNTFTARMLLLLESRPFYGHGAYEALLKRVITAYWRNYESHASDYMPIQLVNDVVRYWRVVLLNYEHKYAGKERKAKNAGLPTEAIMKAKRLASYKLRFARCMTCYSMIALLLWESRVRGTTKASISPEMMLSMVKLSPLGRMQRLLTGVTAEEETACVALVAGLLQLYRGYLESRVRSDEDLAADLNTRSPEGSLFSKADAFGEMMSTLIQELGRKSPLIRYVVV